MALPAQEKSPASARSHQRSLLAMEETMREEIRELQEQRAAAMMTEIVELQKERDLALGKVKRLEKKVKDMEAEATQLRRSSSGSARKAADGRGDLVSLLRQALLEEQLLSSDLKKKLQSVKKQNLALSQQLQESESQLGSPDAQPRRRSHSFESRSTSPLASPTLTPQSHKAPSSHSKTPTTTAVTTPTPDIRIDGTASTPTTSTSASSATASPMPRQPKGYSPTVIPRRYKLTAVTSHEIGTQTDTSTSSAHDSAPGQPPESIATQTSQSEQSADTLAPPILEALTLARADIVRLQSEGNSVKEELGKEIEKRDKFKKESESLQLECSVLRDALTELSRWVRGKLGNMEENMDIFRVIYSLHGSLSQEQSVLRDLQSKLHQAEQKVLQLDLANRHLTLSVSEAEEKYQQSLSQIRALQSRLSRPPLPSPSHLTPPPSSSSRLKGRQFSSPQLPLRRSIPTSPLTTYTPSHPHKNTHDIV